MSAQRETAAGCAFLAVDHRTYGIVVVLRQVGAAVRVVGAAGHHLGIDFDGHAAIGGPVDIEPNAPRIKAQQPPAHQYAGRRFTQRHNTAAQIFHHACTGSYLRGLARRPQAGSNWHDRRAAERYGVRSFGGRCRRAAAASSEQPARRDDRCPHQPSLHSIRHHCSPSSVLFRYGAVEIGEAVNCSPDASKRMYGQTALRERPVAAQAQRRVVWQLRAVGGDADAVHTDRQRGVGRGETYVQRRHGIGGRRAGQRKIDGPWRRAELRVTPVRVPVAGAHRVGQPAASRSERLLVRGPLRIVEIAIDELPRIAVGDADFPQRGGHPRRAPDHGTDLLRRAGVYRHVSLLEGADIAGAEGQQVVGARQHVGNAETAVSIGLDPELVRASLQLEIDALVLRRQPDPGAGGGRCRVAAIGHSQRAADRAAPGRLHVVGMVEPGVGPGRPFRRCLGAGILPQCLRHVGRGIGGHAVVAVDINKIRTVKLPEVRAGLHHQLRALAVMGAIEHIEERARIVRRQLALHRAAVVILVAGHGHPDTDAGAAAAPAPHVQVAQPLPLFVDTEPVEAGAEIHVRAPLPHAGGGIGRGMVQGRCLVVALGAALQAEINVHIHGCVGRIARPRRADPHLGIVAAVGGRIDGERGSAVRTTEIGRIPAPEMAAAAVTAFEQVAALVHDAADRCILLVDADRHDAIVEHDGTALIGIGDGGTGAGSPARRVGHRQAWRQRADGGVLPRHSHAVLRVVHQGHQPPFGRVWRGVDAQEFFIGRVQDHFLAPVAEQVGRQGGNVLGAAGLRRARRFQQVVRFTREPVPLGDAVLVEQFAQLVAVPPHHETQLARPFDALDHLALRGVQEVAVAGPRLGAGEARVDVGGDGAASVGRRRRAPQDFAGTGVQHGRTDAAVVLDLFVGAEFFQSRAGGIEVAHGHRIAMLEAGTPQALAVVVDRHGAVDDFILAVAIDVGHAQLVVALAAELFVARRAAVEGPPPGQFAVAPVPGGQRGAPVVAARHDDAGALAVQISGAGQEAVGAVAVTIAPGVLELRGSRCIGIGMACRPVRFAGQRAAGAAVEDGEKLGAFQDTALQWRHHGAVGQYLAAGAVGRRHFAALFAPVGMGVAQYLAGAVDGAVAGAHGQLGDAVAVVVVHLELRVVGAGADVFSEIDAPQALAVQRVGIEVHRSGVAVEGVIPGVGRIRDLGVGTVDRVPFQDDFIAAVAVEVGNAGFVRGVVVGLAAGRDAGRRLLDRHAQIALVPHDGRLAGAYVLALHDSVQRVGRLRRARFVDVIGAACQRTGRDFLAVAVQVKRGGRGVVAQQAPGDQVAAIPGRYRHRAAVQRFHPTRRSLCCSRKHRQGWSGHCNRCHAVPCRLVYCHHRDRAMLGQRVGEVHRHLFPQRLRHIPGTQRNIGLVRNPALHPQVVIIAMEVARIGLERQRRFRFRDPCLRARARGHRLPLRARRPQIFRALGHDVVAVGMGLVDRLGVTVIPVAHLVDGGIDAPLAGLPHLRFGKRDKVARGGVHGREVIVAANLGGPEHHVGPDRVIPHRFRRIRVLHLGRRHQHVALGRPVDQVVRFPDLDVALAVRSRLAALAILILEPFEVGGHQIKRVAVGRAHDVRIAQAGAADAGREHRLAVVQAAPVERTVALRQAEVNLFLGECEVHEQVGGIGRLVEFFYDAHRHVAGGRGGALAQRGAQHRAGVAPGRAGDLAGGGDQRRMVRAAPPPVARQPGRSPALRQAGRSPALRQAGRWPAWRRPAAQRPATTRWRVAGDTSWQVASSLQHLHAQRRQLQPGVPASAGENAILVTVDGNVDRVAGGVDIQGAAIDHACVHAFRRGRSARDAQFAVQAAVQRLQHRRLRQRGNIDRPAPAILVGRDDRQRLSSAAARVALVALVKRIEARQYLRGGRFQHFVQVERRLERHAVDGAGKRLGVLVERLRRQAEDVGQLARQIGAVPLVVAIGFIGLRGHHHRAALRHVLAHRFGGSLVHQIFAGNHQQLVARQVFVGDVDHRHVEVVVVQRSEGAVLVVAVRRAVVLVQAHALGLPAGRLARLPRIRQRHLGFQFARKTELLHGLEFARRGAPLGQLPRRLVVVVDQAENDLLLATEVAVVVPGQHALAAVEQAEIHQHARAAFFAVEAKVTGLEFVEPHGRGHAALHHHGFERTGNHVAGVITESAMRGVAAVRGQVVETAPAGIAKQVRDCRLGGRMALAQRFEVVEHGQRGVGPEPAQVEVAFVGTHTGHAGQAHLVPVADGARPALRGPGMVQLVEAAVLGLEPADEALAHRFRKRHIAVADLVVEPDGDHGRMLAVARQQFVGKAVQQAPVVGVKDVVHIALGRIQLAAIFLHQRHARVLVVQPLRCGRAADIEQHLDAGRVHLVHHAVEGGKREFAIGGFKIIPRQVAHAHHGQACLFHVDDVLRDLRRGAVHRLVAGTNEQLALPGPVGAGGRLLGMGRGGKQQAQRQKRSAGGKKIAALAAFIAIEPAAAHPLAVDELAVDDLFDADPVARLFRRIGKAHDHAASRRQEFILAGLDDQPSMSADVLGILRCARIDHRDRQRVATEFEGARGFVRHSVHAQRRLEAAHGALSLVGQHQRRHLAQHAVGVGQRIGGRAGQQFDGKRAEADAFQLAQRIKSVGAGVGFAGLVCFRNEDRVVGPLELIGPVGVIREVRVQADQVDVGTARLPDIEQVRQRPAARVLARLLVGPVERHVDVHGQVVGGFTGSRECVGEHGKTPGLEDFLRLGPVAEYLRPGARRLVILGRPHVAHVRVQRGLVLLQVIDQRLGHLPVKRCLRLRAVIAHHRQHADFILHLHHHHRAALVERFQMRHQRAERALVGFQGIGIVRTQDILRYALVVLRLGVGLEVVLDVRRRVRRRRILPGAKPQQHQFHVVGFGLADQAFERLEVVHARLRLDLVPLDRRQHRVDADGFQYRPLALEVLEVGSGRVTKLAAEDQQRLPIDDQVRGRAMFFQMGNWLCGGDRCGGETDGGQKNKFIADTRVITATIPAQIVLARFAAGRGLRDFIGQVLGLDRECQAGRDAVLDLGVEIAAGVHEHRVAGIDIVAARVITATVVIGQARIELVAVVPDRRVITVFRHARERQLGTVERVQELGAARIRIRHARVVGVDTEAAQEARQEGQRGAAGQFHALGRGALEVDGGAHVPQLAVAKQVLAHGDVRLYRRLDVLAEVRQAQLAVAVGIPLDRQVLVGCPVRFQVRIAGRAIVGTVAAEAGIAAAFQAIDGGRQLVDGRTRHHLAVTDTHRQLVRHQPGGGVEAGQIVVVLVVPGNDGVGDHAVVVGGSGRVARHAAAVLLQAGRAGAGARVAHAQVALDVVAQQRVLEIEPQVSRAYPFAGVVRGDLRVDVAVAPQRLAHFIVVEPRCIKEWRAGRVVRRQPAGRVTADAGTAEEIRRLRAHCLDQLLHLLRIHPNFRVIAVNKRLGHGRPLHRARVQRIPVPDLRDVGGFDVQVIGSAGQVGAVVDQVATAVVLEHAGLAALAAKPDFFHEWQVGAIAQVELDLVFRTFRFGGTVIEFGTRVRAGIVRVPCGREREVRPAIGVERHFQARRALHQSQVVAVVGVRRIALGHQRLHVPAALAVIKAGRAVLGVVLLDEVARTGGKRAIAAPARDGQAVAHHVFGDVVVGDDHAGRRGRGGCGITSACRGHGAVGRIDRRAARRGQAVHIGKIGTVSKVLVARILLVALVADKRVERIAELVLCGELARLALVRTGADHVARYRRRIVEPLALALGAVGRHLAQEAPAGVAHRVALGMHLVVGHIGHQAQLAFKKTVGNQEAGARLGAVAQRVLLGRDVGGHRELLEVQRLVGFHAHGAADAALGHVGGNALEHVDRFDQLGRQFAQLGAATRRVVGAQHRQAVDFHPVQVRFHATNGDLAAFAKVARQLHAGDARERLAHVFIGELADVFGHDGIADSAGALLALDSRADRLPGTGDHDHVLWFGSGRCLLRLLGMGSLIGAQGGQDGRHGQGAAGAARRCAGQCRIEHVEGLLILFERAAATAVAGLELRAPPGLRAARYRCSHTDDGRNNCFLCRMAADVERVGVGQVLRLERDRHARGQVPLQLEVEKAGRFDKQRVAAVGVVRTRVIAAAPVVRDARVERTALVPQRQVVRRARHAGERQLAAVEGIDQRRARRIGVAHARKIGVDAEAVERRGQERQRGAYGKFQTLGGGAAGIDGSGDVEQRAVLQQVGTDHGAGADRRVDVLAKVRQTDLVALPRIPFQRQVGAGGAIRLQARVAGRALIHAVAAELQLAAIEHAGNVGTETLEAGTRHHLAVTSAQQHRFGSQPQHCVHAGQKIVVAVFPGHDGGAQQPIVVRGAAGRALGTHEQALAPQRTGAGTGVAQSQVAVERMAEQVGAVIDAHVRRAGALFHVVSGNLRMDGAVAARRLPQAVVGKVRRVEEWRCRAVTGAGPVGRKTIEAGARQEIRRHIAHRAHQRAHLCTRDPALLVVGVNEALHDRGAQHAGGIERIVVPGVADIGRLYGQVITGARQVAAGIEDITAVGVALRGLPPSLHAECHAVDQRPLRAVAEVEPQLVFAVVDLYRIVGELHLRVRGQVVRSAIGGEGKVRKTLAIEVDLQARRVHQQAQVVAVVTVAAIGAGEHGIDIPSVPAPGEACRAVVIVHLLDKVARFDAERIAAAAPAQRQAVAHHVLRHMVVGDHHPGRRGGQRRCHARAARRYAVRIVSGQGTGTGQPVGKGQVGGIVEVVQARCLSKTLVRDVTGQCIAELDLSGKLGGSARVVAPQDAVARVAGAVVVPLALAVDAVLTSQRGAAGAIKDGGRRGIERGHSFFGGQIPVAQKTPAGIAHPVRLREHLVVHQVGHQPQATVEKLVGDQQVGARLHAAAQAVLLGRHGAGKREFFEVQRAVGPDQDSTADAAFGEVGGDALDHLDRLDQLGGQFAQIGGARAVGRGQYRGAIDLDAVQVRLHAADRDLVALAKVARDLHPGHARQRLAHVFIGELANVLGDDGIGHCRRVFFQVDGGGNG
uniref:Uncharacterized protein n=1 Tax=Tanacetum cinerariifolium TaxID=118510 RepID=A0A699GGK6_TANCI|nr:hypothetical protein [Tanacetum cinerariifolium]